MCEIKQLCRNIRYIRESEELSQEEMSIRLSIPLKVLQKIEEGSLPATVTVELLWAIENQFGIHPAVLFAPFYRL